MHAARVFDQLRLRLAAREWAQAAELYAPDVEVVNRFALEGSTRQVGREAVAGFFTGLGGRLDSLSISDVMLYEGADPEVLVAEFSFAATAGGGTVAFQLPAVFVMRVRDGQIISSHDYIGPHRDTAAPAPGATA